MLAGLEPVYDALKGLLGGTIREMMEAEMDKPLVYEKSERSDNDDFQNGYKRKRVKSSYGSIRHPTMSRLKQSEKPPVIDMPSNGWYI